MTDDSKHFITRGALWAATEIRDIVETHRAQVSYDRRLEGALARCLKDVDKFIEGIEDAIAEGHHRGGDRT